MSADASGDLHQWRADSGQEVNPSGIPRAQGGIYAAVVSKDGRWIVSGDAGFKVIVWNAITYQIAIEVSEHTNFVFAVDVSSDSTRIVSGSKDRTVRIFNIISGARILPPLHHDGAVVGVKFSPDDSQIATATYSKSVRVYDVHSGNTLFDISITVTSALITPLAWSPDGQQLFVGSPGKITSFDTSTSFRSEWPIQNSNRNVSIVAHGQVSACSAGSSVSFWDHTSCKQIGSIVDHATTVHCISISHDGKYLACGCENGITVHDLADLLPRDYFRTFRLSRIPLIQVSERVLESWLLGNIIDTESTLSGEIAQCSDSSHYAFAARSLLRTHLGEWKTAIEDAEMVTFSCLNASMFTECTQSPSRSDSRIWVRLQCPSPSLVQIDRKTHLMALTSSFLTAIRVIACFF